jgi:hypothetical protein
MEYKVKLIDKKIAKELIIKNHYSHKWTSCRYALGLFKEDELKGVAIYGFPVGRQVVGSLIKDKSVLKNENVLELTRLWINDSEGKNTESYFLGKTFWWLKNNDTKVKILISYSDPMYGHKGGIYQATNWWYQGNNTMLIKSYLHKINNEILHPRTVVAKYGTIKVDELKKKDINYERIEMKKKHRYLYVLNKKDRKFFQNNLKHPLLPYPKDNNDTNW